MGRAAAAAVTATRVKELLRRVYRRVHPDLFGSQPKAQAVNERSMQELQGMWETMAGPKLGPRENGEVLSSVTFFFMRRGRDTGSLAKAQAWVAPGPQLVRGLIELLSQLEPGEDLSKFARPGARDGFKATHGSPKEPDEVLARLRQAGDEARRRVLNNTPVEATQSGAGSAPSTENRVFITTLQRVYGLQAVFGNDVSPEQRPWLCRRLAQAVDAIGPDGVLWRGGCVELNGGAVCEVSAIYSDKMKYQPRRLVLGACAPHALWTSALSSGSFAQVCREERELQSICHETESRVAEALGVSMVVSSCPSHGDPRYLGFLSEVRKAATGWEGRQEYGSVAVLVEIGGARKSQKVLNRPGVVRVALEGGVAATLSTVEREGLKAHQLALEVAATATLQEATRRAIRARGVTRADGLSEEEWNHGLGALRGSAGALRGVLDGTWVVVGREVRAGDGRWEVEVPWDVRLR